jgi:branched-subunit amino acid transport protein
MPDRIWLLLVAAGVATFLLRHAFSLIFGSREVPPLLRAILPFIPAAALAALVAPQVVIPAVEASTLLHPKLLAWLGAMLVAWKTRNMLLTIATGLGLLQLFLVVLQ